MLSKRALVERISEQIQAELTLLANASRAMHADASDEQNKAEDKYDTRGLETAYLASSQARQATEAEQSLAAYQTLTLAKFAADAPIAVGALIELESRGEHAHYFLGPKGGGIEVRSGQTEVLVITPESPLGAQLLGRRAGDRIQLKTQGPAQSMRIIAVR